SKYLSREQHFSARTVCVNALYKSRDGACALRYSILAARIGLDRATHVSKQQFDVEFPIYREVREKLVGLRQAFFALRPFVSEIVPSQVGQERLQRRIDTFNSAYAEFVNAVDRNQPFYSYAIHALRWIASFTQSRS